ncbi:lipase family protein [uncultured Cocleimonas sp.]|uniref:lipase family protein n=1 Tax=uncultured Cocleimonas sp. TaxID=1051587 RepID=UPI002638689B|nr:lipase family protein [uncultured Cocleimonas sp.]
MDQQTPVIANQQANQITLRSAPCDPENGHDINSKDLINKALLFAELSMIAYLKPEETEKAALRLGFTRTTFYNNDGSQAYSFANDQDIVIAFRGTEPNEWNDIKADIDATKALAETVGHVHRGFKKEVDDVWPLLEKMLISHKQNLDKKLWFTGHSLGGAMASICAGRCLLSHIDTRPEQVHTFGSPRVGTKRYINHAKVDYYRWVNNNDIVTRTPPVWLGYRHAGKEMYLDAQGRLKELNAVQRKADLWKGFVIGLKNKQIDHFSDHLIDNYVDYIYEETKPRSEG